MLCFECLANPFGKGGLMLKENLQKVWNGYTDTKKVDMYKKSNLFFLKQELLCSK